MPKAYKLDCGSETGDCRFIIQSENKKETMELAQKHTREHDSQDYSEDELQKEHLQVI